jgi:hypothetical protein
MEQGQWTYRVSVKLSVRPHRSHLFYITHLVPCVVLLKIDFSILLVVRNNFR